MASKMFSRLPAIEALTSYYLVILHKWTEFLLGLLSALLDNFVTGFLVIEKLHSAGSGLALDDPIKA